ncbi:hypothetical protein F5Y16DRAFT_244248 [Xylariaceae sp. FL0255]|nr:hypothetical protein F5Y16DRAFT_244248 [Xylariaceae sp. FL0255]
MAAIEPKAPGSPTDPSSTPSKKRKSQIDEIEVDLKLPEPPSKKAKRALKKGKPLPTKPTSHDEADDGLDVPKTKDGKDGGKDKKQRSEHGIWIGNLPFTMTRLELFKWLVECSGGVIKEENITRVNLPLSKNLILRRPMPNGGVGEAEDKQQKQNKGFAYIDFDAEAAAVAAMALTETEINGRKVLIKNAASFEGRPQPAAAAAGTTSTSTSQTADANGNPSSTTQNNSNTNPNASRKIYVGNLSFQVTEDDIHAQFEKCGEIDWVKIATFEDSGKCKGYGWVKFKEPEAAAWAVKGFVKIREEVETEEDFRDDEGGDDGGEKSEKKFQMRKWWVNRLHGRDLKIELAEDDQTRYKKRYGKGAQGRNSAGKDGQQRRQPNNRNDGDGKENAAPPRPKRPGYGDAETAAFKTGVVVKGEGKKITFD